MNNSPAITINNMQFSWSKKSTNPSSYQPFMHIPQWQINQGERVFLQGESGTGKSTLLNLLSGLLQADKGSIQVLDTQLNTLSNRERDTFRAQNLGIIFQQFNLIPYLSVRDNIKLSQAFSNVPLDEQRIESLCEQLKLPAAIIEQPANQLSVGQQQRVAVARALYHQPPIIIADEPTSALDSHTRDEFIQLLLSQSQKTQSTVIFVSHDHSMATHFDRVENITKINQAAGQKSE